MTGQVARMTRGVVSGFVFITIVLSSSVRIGGSGTHRKEGRP